MEFTLAGRKVDLNSATITDRMQGVEPEIVRTHAVEIDGKRYPVKQVLSAITGIPKADFNSHQARQILRRIGLEVSTGDETTN